jgi:dihydroorotate dehydrogenase (fumarate)
MKLTTSYLGLQLRHPFMPGASPLADTLDSVLKLEDAGAAAIVMRSLFEEQILRERFGFVYHTADDNDPAQSTLTSYPPRADEYTVRPDEYLERLRLIKSRVAVPVIASLNGTESEGWLQYARLLQKAGADAMELNFYHLATRPEEDGTAVERRLLDLVAVVKETVRIPIAVKLSPFYSSLPNVAERLESMGVQGVVVFNQFYQPDLDPEELDVAPKLRLSTSADLLLRLQWLAILSSHFRGSLAVSGGVHQPIDAVKAIMSGADAVQMVSALMRNGPQHLAYVIKGFEAWGDAHGYETVDDLRDALSMSHCQDPRSFGRAVYIRSLHSTQRSR